MASRDTGRVVVGLVIFLVLVSFPIWFSATRGQAEDRPELEYPAGETACVETREYMRTWHMDLLNEWRDSVVREGVRNYVSDAHHTEHDMSLQNTCMKCHANKAAFCDRCHDYVGVKPKCWACHVEPRGGE